MLKIQQYLNVDLTQNWFYSSALRWGGSFPRQPHRWRRTFYQLKAFFHQSTPLEKNFLKLSTPARPEEKPEVDQPQLKLTRRRRLDFGPHQPHTTHAQGRKLTRQRLRYYHRGGYRPRWGYQLYPHRQLDPLQIRWIWSTKHRGSFIHQRNLTIHQLTFPHQPLTTHHLQTRLAQLHHQLHHLMVKVQRYHRLNRHQTVHHLPKGKKIRLDRRRYLQRRLIRLRRRLEFKRKLLKRPRILAGQHIGTYQFYKPNRFNWLEVNQLTRPKADLLGYLARENAVRKNAHPRRFNSFDYLYFNQEAINPLERTWRRDLNRIRYTKSGQVRMKTLQDHPEWGLWFKQERARRLSFVSQGPIYRATQRWSGKIKQYLEVVPHQLMEMMLYAGRVDTRRKLDSPATPEGRGLSSFLQSFMSGLVVEKKQKKIFPTTLRRLLQLSPYGVGGGTSFKLTG